MNQVIGYIIGGAILAYGSVVIGTAIYHESKKSPSMSTPAALSCTGLIIIMSAIITMLTETAFTAAVYALLAAGGLVLAVAAAISLAKRAKARQKARRSAAAIA